MSYCFTDKYDCIKILYQSAATKVMLVRQKGHKEQLVAKRTDKNQAVSSDIFHEANLLQEIRHPAIPIFYETIEDNDYLYIIEEYAFGDSLEKYLLYHQHISQKTFFIFAIQLCEVIEFLHTHTSNPILYLDMKPSHIIVCGKQIKIIDFGIANHLPISGKNIQKYGTKKYAAPEQTSHEKLNEQTDVYGVGRVLGVMLKYMKKADAVKYLWVVHKATRKNRKFRTKNISILKKELLHKQKKENKKLKNRKYLSYSIAVVGSDSGVGCTHIAIALVSYLNQAGLNAYYRNHTEQLVVEQLAKQESMPVCQDQIIYHEFFQGMLYSGTNKEKNPLGGIQVIDCGCKVSPTNADATIYVCGGRLWQRAKPPTWDVNKEYIVICNFFSRNQAKQFSREIDRCIYVFPFLNNPFILTTTAKKVFSKIMQSLNLK